MAARTLLLVCLLAVVSAVVTAQTFSGAEAALRTAITDLGVTSFTLTQNVILTADMPPIPDNKVFILTGKVGSKKATIDGASEYTIFQANGGTLGLSNLIIQNAKQAVPATVLSGTKFTATNVDFKKNYQALALTSVDATITGCTFTGHPGGAIDVQKEEGEPDRVRINGCTFTTNQRQDGGAAIYGGKYSTLNISNSKFTSNAVSYRGGAIRIIESSFATITKSAFTGNKASDSAGAISVFNAGASISGSTFTNNVALGPGGALRVTSEDGFGADATITSSTFSGNSALSGGAFVLDATNDDSRISFCKTTFSKNKNGNGIAFGSTNTILTKGAVPIPGVTASAGAVLTYQQNTKCK